MAGLKRRDVLLLGGMAALVIGWQNFARRRESALEFKPVRGAPDWRVATAGAISALSSMDLMTIGLEAGTPPLDAGRLDAVVHRGGGTIGVPVAVFSDFFCPYCRGLLGRLKSRDASPSLDITWHELPLLGQNSVRVARVAVAADLQGGYVAFYGALLQQGFRPSETYLMEVAERAGLDIARLRKDMDGGLVAARLDDSAAAASRLGIFGTPGIAIAKRVVVGALERAEMERLIAQAALV